MESTLHTVPTHYWPKCPFRGFPVVVLDDRCPPTIQAIGDSVDTGEKVAAEEQPDPDVVRRGRKRINPVMVSKEGITNFIPIVQADSYCAKCLGENIREEEMGIKTSKKAIGIVAGKKKGKKR